MTDGRLALTVTSSDGTTKRWGPDEASAEDVLGGLSFTSSIPGGFKTLSCNLLRRIDVDYPDLGLLDELVLYGPGGEIVWEGHQQSMPRQHGGDSFGIVPNAVGYSSELTYPTGFREIYVDRGLGQFGGVGATRRLSHLGTFTIGDPQVIADEGQAALQLEAAGAWTAATKPLIEAWYDSGGIPIGSLYYAWKIGSSINSADTNWTWQNFLADDDATASADITANLRAAGPSTGTLTATTNTRRFAALQLFYIAGPAGGDGAAFPLLYTCLAVYGRHGLTKRGAEDATNAKGFYASDVIADVVTRAAPKLNFTTGAEGSIQPTTFVIPQLAFPDPVTAEEVILRSNAYHLWTWGVYDRREFFFRPWDDTAQPVWEVRLLDGAQVSLEGDDAENLVNGVLVHFTDPAGKRRLVGPPGVIADATDAALADTNPENPVNAWGHERYGTLEISITTTIAAAIQIGAVWLAEHNRPQRRGSLTVVGDVYHPARGPRPGWAVRAGDFVRITDHSAKVPRKLTEVRYDRDTLTLSCTLDNSAFRLDAILERMGVALVGIG